MSAKADPHPSSNHREEDSWVPALAMAGAFVVALFVPWTIWLVPTGMGGELLALAWIPAGAAGLACVVAGGRRREIGQALIVGDLIGFLLFVVISALWLAATFDGLG